MVNGYSQLNPFHHISSYWKPKYKCLLVLDRSEVLKKFMFYVEHATKAES